MTNLPMISERKLTAGYSVALGLVAVLALASHMTLNRVLAEHEGSAEILNVSGRQRMLSQRIASLAAQYRLGVAGARADLLASVALFEAAHARLLTETAGPAAGGGAAGEFREIYFGGAAPLDGEVTGFVRLARRVAAEPPNSAASAPALQRLLANAREPLLTRLDGVVALHERKSEQQLARLELLQQTTLAVVLVTLAVEALMIFRPMVRRVARYARDLLQMATVDGLTGTLNRASFLERGAVEWERARRAGGSLAVVMIDADHFKRINDSFGHAGGDAVLRALGAAIGGAARKSDLAGRLGGEEFAMILPDTDAAAAFGFAQRLRCEVERLEVPAGEQSARVTASLGVAAARPGRDGCEDLAALLRRADHALYAAKGAGRNRVILADGETAAMLAWPPVDGAMVAAG